MRKSNPPPPPRAIDLRRSFRRPRTLISAVLSGITGIAAVAACVPLFSVLIMLLYRGGRAITWHSFVELPPTAFESGGGFGNAIVGTAVMVGIAVAISVPFGILTAVFLAFFDPGSKLAWIVRFCAKVLSGFPSILAGVLGRRQITA